MKIFCCPDFPLFVAAQFATLRPSPTLRSPFAVQCSSLLCQQIVSQATSSPTNKTSTSAPFLHLLARQNILFQYVFPTHQLTHSKSRQTRGRTQNAPKRRRTPLLQQPRPPHRHRPRGLLLAIRARHDSLFVLFPIPSQAHHNTNYPRTAEVDGFCRPCSSRFLHILMEDLEAVAHKVVFEPTTLPGTTVSLACASEGGVAC